MTPRFTRVCRLLLVLALLLVGSADQLSYARFDVEPAAIADEPLPAATAVETLLADAGGFVVAMAFAPDGRLFYTVKGGFGGEQDAQVRIVEQDVLRPTPFLTVRVDTLVERGLTGIALDPNFITNRFVYVTMTVPSSETGTGRPANRVIRYAEDPASQTAITATATVLMDIPLPPDDEVHASHYGGILRFGSDGKLYVTSGDYFNPPYSQDLTVPMGKIHRINSDGSIPSDNPFVSTPAAISTTWVLGVRNSFGLAFDPIGGAMFFTENGPACDDEVNLGIAGGNYAWPNDCGEYPPGTIAPLFAYTSTVGITGIEFYRGRIVPWYGSLFWCAFDNGLLYRASLDSTRTQIQSVSVVNGAPACRVALKRGPDGALYTSSGSIISRIRSTAPVSNSALLPMVFK